MLTGKTPFTGDNELAVRWAHAQDPRPLVSQVLPALGHRYDAFFVKALAIDPDARFGSEREFAEALTAAQSGTGETDPTARLDDRTHEQTKAGPATPPPPRPGAQTPPPYAYATPPPQPAQRDSSTGPLALIILGIVAILGIAAAALAAAGVFTKESSPTSSTVAQRPAKSAGRNKKAAKETNGGHTEGAVTPPAGSSACPGAKTLWVNSHTSCPFAHNTRSAYAEAGGSHNLEVYSPVTGTTYAMTCNGTGLVTCTGGEEAAVYFSKAKATGQYTAPVRTPEPTPEPEPEYSGGGGGAATQACDENIYVNSVTTCPFAENVFVAYWDEWETYGDSPYLYVTAYSEAKGKDYGMDCYDDADFVECTGGKEALVTFPMQAVREY